MRRSAVMVLALVVSLAAAGVGATDASAAGNPLDVRIRSGVIRGVATDPGVAEWRGVPYAAAPLGDLRWRPPAAVPTWSNIRDASEFAPVCIQRAHPGKTTGSEDCLYLNVFAPDDPAARDGLPVMVHLHPGNNSGFHPYTNATTFVQRGAIVVTVGYRLGVFGFVGHPALSVEGGGSSGEYGVLDQLAALEWVQQNIGAFGGDPRNVTLFGDSAGSFDTVAIVASPLGQGLIRRAAIQTESWWAVHGTGTIFEAERLGERMAKNAGCGQADDVLACLRSASAVDLVTSTGFLDIAPWVGGVVLPKPPLRLIAEQPHPVPMIVGSNREEAVGFLPLFAQDKYGTVAWTRDSNVLLGPENGDAARRIYPPDAYDSTFWQATALFTDAVYTCPIRALASAARAPVYRYLYTHRYENSPFLATFRAGHFLDDPIRWHDPSLLAGFGEASYQFSPSEETLAALMADYWTNFAKTGDPNGPNLPPWPLYTAQDETSVVLDTPASLVHDYHSAECTFLDPLELYPRPPPKPAG